MINKGKSKAAKFLDSINEMARGRVVLDADLRGIELELTKKNITVIAPEQSLSDLDLKRNYLAGRILITNNSKDFVDDAIAYEYGIIATEGLPSKEPKQTADMISKAIIKHSLWSQSSPFILTLKSDGKHVLRFLSERK